MDFERAKKIADAVLYEGYLLYPYRRSSIKNRQRWTFGGVLPRAFAEMQPGAGAWCQQTQCLVLGANPTIDVRLRFLHLLVRQDGGGDMPRETSQEAVERTVDCLDVLLSDLNAAPRRMEFSFPASRTVETVGDDPTAGTIVQEQQPIQGSLEISAEQVAEAVGKLTLRILNMTPLEPDAHLSYDEALLHSFVSTHSILGLHDGAFVSLLDPPQDLAEIAASCQNIGAYPVLVGDEGSRDLMLSSPIILYDYPRVALESAGDLFDSTEIDEILSLRILTLTDQEKDEVRQADARGRELLDRTEALTPEALMRLHGTLREMRPGAKP